MSIKQKTVKGLKWSFADNIVNQGLHFIVGIVLARLLSPSEFGIIGIITVFTSMSQLIVDSGLSQSLIRKKTCTEEDWNTMFYSNITLGLVTCIMLVLAAPAIARFYEMPEISKLLRVMSLVLVINAIGLVEQTQLIRLIEFKSITKISIVSSVVSGIVGIVLALLGFSYWSLVWKSIVQNLVRVFLLRVNTKWHPSLMFSRESFLEMFGFGSRLLVSQFIGKGYQNTYYFLIGKFFSARELGLYSKAEQFKNLPTDNIINTIQRVTYPILSQMNDQPQKQIEVYRRLLRTLFYAMLTIVIGIVSFSQETIIILLGHKWEEVIPYLRILALSAIPMPLSYLNMNMLKVRNRPDLYMKVEILKKLIFIPAVVWGVLMGINLLLVVIVIISIMDYLINSIASSKVIKYPLKMQIVDIAPIVVYGLTASAILWLFSLLSIRSDLLSLLMKGAILLSVITFMGECMKMKEYQEIKQVTISYFAKGRR